MTESLIGLIEVDHDKIRSVVRELRNACERDEEDRDERFVLSNFQVLKALITAHTKAMEVAVYGLLKDLKSGSTATLRHFALEGLEEHIIIDRLLNEMSKIRQVNDRWRAKLKMTSDLLDRHFEEEERDFLKEFMAAIEPEELHSLTGMYTKTRDQVLQKEQPAPRTVSDHQSSGEVRH